MSLDHELDALQRRWEAAKTLQAKHHIELAMEKAAARALGKPTAAEQATVLDILTEWRDCVIEVGV